MSQRPRPVAVVAPGRTLTQGELDERQRHVAGVLAALGLAPGERIAVHSGNRPEVLEVTLGALRAGVVPAMAHALLVAHEVRDIVAGSGARVLFTDDDSLEPFGALERVIPFGAAYERLLAGATSGPVADVALTRPMHFTSGTTGRPKGVWTPPASAEVALAASRRFRELWGLAGGDVHLVCSPLTHSAPHRFALRTLEAGGCVVLQDGFDAHRAIDAIRSNGATSSFMVPTHLERIVAASPARRDLASIGLLAHAGAPVRPDTKRRIIDLFPDDSVWEFYGSTEGRATRISSPEWLRHPGSVGRAEPGCEVFVTNDDGAPLPPGESGRVWVRDAWAEPFAYWGDEGATRAAWRDGAYSAGDLGSLDDDGYLYLTGRAGEWIVTGGVNVYPQEVEAVLLRHPGVGEALVYGAPSEEWGEEVRALVVPRTGRLDPEEVRAWARARLAGFKRPRRIEVVDELPRTATGKLLRRPRA